MTEPYYSDDAVTIYHGDARDVLATLDGVTATVFSPPYNVDMSERYCDIAASRLAQGALSFGGAA